MRYTLLFLSILVPATGVHAQPKLPGDPYQSLVQEFAVAQRAYVKRLESAIGIADQGKLFREANPQPAFALRFLDLAKKHAGEPIAFASLNWVVQNAEFGPAAEKPYGEAVALLASRHADHKDAETLFERMGISPFASSREYLQAVFDKHPKAATRGRAGFHLAMHLKNYCDTADQLRLDPATIKNTELFVGRDLIQRLLAADTARLRRDAEAALERVRKNHAFVSFERNNKRTTLGKAAEAELFELRNLTVGKTPPDLDGVDLDGKKFKLSDYRGKVTVVVFWGTWCPHCMAMVPQERAMVQRLAGQPFALLGVNSDPDPKKLTPSLAKHGITWRSFWDGGDTDGPIATRWNVLGWPTVYVLDAKGVIRYRHVRGETLDRVVDALIKQMKAKPEGF